MVNSGNGIEEGEGKSQRRGLRGLSGHNSDTFLNIFVLAVKCRARPNKISKYSRKAG